MAGDARHASHVDADGRQDTAGPSAPAESMVARGALRHRARTDLVADPLRRRPGPSLLPDVAASGSDHQALPGKVSREVEPRALLLGRLRSRPRAIQRAARVTQGYRLADPP